MYIYIFIYVCMTRTNEKEDQLHQLYGLGVGTRDIQNKRAREKDKK